MSDFDAAAISLKAQKKLASKMCDSKRAVRVMLQQRTVSLMDELFRSLLLAGVSRREAELVGKSIVKLMVKAAVLFRCGQFSQQQLQAGRELTAAMRQLAMTVISFHRVEFSYDRSYLLQLLARCESLLSNLLAGHVTEKSLARSRDLFALFRRQEVTDSLFLAAAKSPLHQQLDVLCAGLDSLLDDGVV